MSAPANDTGFEKPNPHPVTLIETAVLWARASGIHVRIGSRGVHCSSLATPRWTKDPQSRGIDPVGAALLHYQPEGDDPEEAAAECLFATVEYIRAFEVGLAHENFDDAWASAADKMLRMAAYEHGLRFREKFLRMGLAS